MMWWCLEGGRVLERGYQEHWKGYCSIGGIWIIHRRDLGILPRVLWYWDIGGGCWGIEVALPNIGYGAMGIWDIWGVTKK